MYPKQNFDDDKDNEDRLRIVQHAYSKSKMADDRHFKIDKSPYPVNGLTDRHEICHILHRLITSTYTIFYSQYFFLRPTS